MGGCYLKKKEIYKIYHIKRHTDKGYFLHYLEFIIHTIYRFEI